MKCTQTKRLFGVSINMFAFNRWAEGLPYRLYAHPFCRRIADSFGEFMSFKVDLIINIYFLHLNFQTTL